MHIKVKSHNGTVNGTKENRILSPIVNQANHIASNGSSNGLDKNKHFVDCIKTIENDQSKRTIVQKLHEYRRSIR